MGSVQFAVPLVIRRQIKVAPQNIYVFLIVVDVRFSHEMFPDRRVCSISSDNVVERDRLSSPNVFRVSFRDLCVLGLHYFAIQPLPLDIFEGGDLARQIAGDKLVVEEDLSIWLLGQSK